MEKRLIELIVEFGWACERLGVLCGDEGCRPERIAKAEADKRRALDAVKAALEELMQHD